MQNKLFHYMFIVYLFVVILKDINVEFDLV